MPRLRSLAAATFGPRALAAVLYGVLALPLALAGFFLTFVGLAFGGALSVTTLGLWLLAVTVRGALALGVVQRGLARKLLGLEIEPPGAADAGSGVLGWRRGVLLDRAGWRAVGCALLTPFTAVFAYAAVVIGYVYGVLL
ncbi:sensor domain-containing protein, partial [Streptomyces sp. NPDC005492]|uniref:sensor domain-containing protein n=1 Tax=Streptomyces sp. NPDC005492 TaxID=3156883 RepID=UPI0033B1B395